MKRATILAFAGLLTSFVLPEARALDAPRSFRASDWQNSLRFDYTTTDSNHEGSGAEPLPEGGKFALMNFNFRSRYVISEKWAVNGGMNFGNGESSNSMVNRSGSAFTAMNAGAEMLIEAGAIDLIPEASILFPFEKISADQDTLITSEGVMETLLNLNAQADFGSFVMYGSLGYDLRGGGRSNLLPWSLGLQFQPKRMKFGARLFGYESVSDDADKGNEISRTETITRTNASSKMFYAVNPSVVDSDLYLIIPFGKNWDLRLGGGATLTGRNTAATYHGDATLTFRFSTVPVARRAREKSNLVVDPFVDSFKEDVDDGVDQKIFEPAPKQLQMRPDGGTAPKMKKVRTTIRPDDARMQKDLDKTEMQIELKADKKSKSKKKKKK